MDFPLNKLKELPAGSTTLEQLIAARNADAREYNTMVDYLRANHLHDGTGITFQRSENGMTPKLGTITAACAEGGGFSVTITD